LAVANALIASLEAELKASQKAWDIATAAKATTEKSANAAAAKVKKAEKALIDANQGDVWRVVNDYYGQAVGKLQAESMMSTTASIFPQ
jgi:hypothetical protein